jgi:CDP-4-dehydro-6-deoxyglucose reductase, E1
MNPFKKRLMYGGAYTDKADFDAIQGVLDRNWWTIDEQGKQLEKELAKFTGNKFATLTNSGSSALMVAYASLGLPEGSEVITGAVHFPTTIASLYYNRLTPVYIDNEAQTLGLDPNLIEKAISSKTKAIIVVAIAGSVPKIDEILAVAKKHNLITILDNCDGFGGTYKGKLLESYFDVSVTSFHAAHILCMGEGGAVFTNNPSYGHKAASLREWGRLGGYDGINDKQFLEGIPDDYPARYLFQYMGFNVKPLELQCAMGRTQLKKLPIIKEKRLRNFDRLYHGLEDIPQIKLLNYDNEASWFGFPLFASNRGKLRDFLESKDIETRTIFGGNITKQPGFRGFGRIASPLPIADWVMTDGMFVSVHPDLTDEMVDYIVSQIQEFYK